MNTIKVNDQAWQVYIYLLKCRCMYKMKIFHAKIIQSKKEGKDQESIQSNTTPDPDHHMGK